MTSPHTPTSFAFPSTIEQALLQKKATSEFLAGGTDVVARLKAHHPSTKEVLVHLRNLSGLNAIVSEEGHIRVGAKTTLTAVAHDASLLAQAAAFSEAARHTATPQIRNRATVAGALFQRPRCDYFRDVTFHCAKEGGSQCFAKDGDHSRHAIFDTQTCSAPHPSSIATALLALDASVVIATVDAEQKATSKTVPLDAVLTVDPKDPTTENALSDAALVTHVVIPVRNTTSAQIYRRASARERADWADVEVSIVLGMVSSVVADARIFLGAVGRVPVRASLTERALVGQTLGTRTIRRAAALATNGAKPLPQNQWKVAMTHALVEDALTALLDRRIDEVTP